MVDAMDLPAHGTDFNVPFRVRVRCDNVAHPWRRFVRTFSISFEPPKRNSCCFRTPVTMRSLRKAASSCGYCSNAFGHWRRSPSVDRAMTLFPRMKCRARWASLGHCMEIECPRRSTNSRVVEASPTRPTCPQ